LNKPAGRKSAVICVAGAKAQGKRKFFAGFLKKKRFLSCAPFYVSFPCAAVAGLAEGLGDRLCHHWLRLKD
jgi:hypothetical protein